MWTQSECRMEMGVEARARVSYENGGEDFSARSHFALFTHAQLACSDNATPDVATSLSIAPGGAP